MSKQTDSRTPAASADSHQQMGMRWRERAEKLELQAFRHSGTYGKANDIYVSFIARAETLKDCANELEFHCDHEWHALARLPKGWQDVCVICGKRRFASQDAIRTCFYEVVWKATEASEMSFVSDPFATLETAMDHAKWRDGRGEPSQIWQIVKTKELLRK